MNNFFNKFEQYNFPNLGFIRIPKIKILEKDKIDLKLQENVTSNQYLRALVKRGFEEKLKLGIIPVEKREIYSKRLEHEYNEITKLLFTDYILLVYKIIAFCQANEILNSAGRGSAAGSLLLFVLKITHIDPIKYNLLFERFVSSARTEIKEIDGGQYLASSSLADIDIDSDRNLKYKINAFIESEYPNKTAAIKTFSTYQGKSVIKDCFKILEEASEDDSKIVSDLIESRFGKVEEIHKALESNDKFKKWAEKHKKVVDVSQCLNGLIKNTGVHASGVFLCENTIQDTLPLELSSDKKLITSFDMDDSQLFGVKIDNLGLKNLGAIRECLFLINKTIYDIDILHPSIYEYFNNRDDFCGLFQLEEDLGKNTLKKLQVKNLEDVCLSISLARPGSYRFVDDVVKYRRTGTFKKYDDDRINEALKDTYGILIYQESLMKLCRVMANFTPQECDGVRKATGKKIKEKMLSYKEKFIKQSIENGFNEKTVLDIWESFESSADYSFNRSHGCAYSATTCVTAYLKVNHPKEFFLALLKNCQHEAKPMEEIGLIQRELINFGIILLPPHIIKSGLDFTIEGDNIRFGLGNIKGISAKTIEKLNKFRNVHSNKLEIFKAADESGLPISVLSSLILVGSLDGEKFNTTRSKLVLEAQLYRLLTDKEKNLVSDFGGQFNYSLIDIIKHISKEARDIKGKLLIKESRYATLKRNFAPYHEMYNFNKSNEILANYYMEYELLGGAYSHQLIDIFRKHCDDLITISQIKASDEGERVHFAARIYAVKEGVSKSKNKYIKVFCSDHTSNFMVMLCNSPKFDKIGEFLEENGAKMKESDIIVVRGKKSNDMVWGDKITIQNVEVFDKISKMNRAIDKKLNKSLDSTLKIQ